MSGAKAPAGGEKEAYGGGGARRGKANQSPERRESVSPLRGSHASQSPNRDAQAQGGQGSLRNSRDDDGGIAEMQRALRDHASLPHTQGSAAALHREEGQFGRQRFDPDRVSVADGVHGTIQGGGGTSPNLHGDASFYQHINGRGVGGWQGGGEGGSAAEGDAGKKNPLRQILPAYLKAVGGGKAKGGGSGDAGKRKLAKPAIKGSFARAAASEYQGRVGKSSLEFVDEVARPGKARKGRKADFGVEDLIARTWAAPDFDEPNDEGDDAVGGGGRAYAWEADGHVGGQRGRGERARSALDDEYGVPIEPLALDSMMALPAGLYVFCLSEPARVTRISAYSPTDLMRYRGIESPHTARSTRAYAFTLVGLLENP